MALYARWMPMAWTVSQYVLLSNYQAKVQNMWYPRVPTLQVLLTKPLPKSSGGLGFDNHGSFLLNPLRFGVRWEFPGWSNPNPLELYGKAAFFLLLKLMLACGILLRLLGQLFCATSDMPCWPPDASVLWSEEDFWIAGCCFSFTRARGAATCKHL